MALKEYSKETPETEDDWQGAWGTIALTPHSVTTLCLERTGDGKEKYSYPYRSLSRWFWKEGEPEILEILAGKDLITLTGRGLQRLLEALDSEQLERIREQAKGDSDEIFGIHIQDIRIEKAG